VAELTPAPGGYPIKLVRDKTAKIVNPSGVPGQLWYGKAPLADRERFLKLKLAEEVGEYLVDGGAEELADVYAVVRALFALQHIYELDALVSADPRGGFLDGVMMYGRHDEFDGQGA
jgi:predicted house-cleaning noncanonical NTP pyrophosphatase (MazG superfamily)